MEVKLAMSSKPLLTIFTPTYNRGYLLKRLYESLKNQDDLDFEWVVVDDGSSDDTESIVRKWVIAEKLFTIKYMKQENGGKHRAINTGVQIAKGKMFFIVDSDDYLSIDAVRKIKNTEKRMRKANENINIAGIAKGRCYSDGRAIGETFMQEYIYASSLERNKYNIKGDKAEIFYLDILKRYPFPEFEGEKFMEEAYIWNRIAEDGYVLRWDNDLIYYCEYLEDGLTRAGKKKYASSPRGYALYVNQLLNHTDNKLQKMRLYSLYSKNVYNYQHIEKTARALHTNSLTVWLAIILRRLVHR